jgi:dTDP-4-amino-4,6-dideoxygalactose transaminase
MLPPSRYWILDRIPFLGLGVSRFDPNFEITRLSAYQMKLATQLLPLIDPHNQIRRDNARRLQAGIEGVEGIEIPQPVNGANPVYLRFSVLAKSETHRARLLKQLRGAGIGASTSYPTTIADIPGIQRYLARDQQPCPQARSIAARILTLPTHPYVTSADIQSMVAVIREDHGHSGKTDG